MFSKARLIELLQYNPLTGKLYRRKSGKEAFTNTIKHGYKQGMIEGKNYLAHRVIWAMHYDEWPDEIDHKDHNGSNNLLDNLRATDRNGNNRNLSIRHDNTSGVTGVYLHDCGKWQARIQRGKSYKSLGLFATKEEAIRRRKAAEFLYGFHENHGA